MSPMQIVAAGGAAFNVGRAFTNIDPFRDGSTQGPVAVTVKLNEPAADGVPVMVKTPAL